MIYGNQFDKTVCILTGIKVTSELLANYNFHNIPSFSKRCFDLARYSKNTMLILVSILESEPFS